MANTNHSSHRDTVRYFGMITQLGLNIVTPLLLCLWLGNWLQRWLGLGQWVVLVALLLGLGSAAVSAVKFLQSAMAEAKARAEKEREA